MKQEKKTRKGNGETGETSQVSPAKPGTFDDNVDALLEEIDKVLEEDARAFTDGYVQKGGEL